jgi:ribosomal protein S18 acetylase RimI-like enzyme
MALPGAFVVREVPVALTRELRQQVLRPHEGVEELAADEAPSLFCLGAFLPGLPGEERLVAVGMITQDDPVDGWRIRGMATASDQRGRGAGGAVLDALLARARAGGAQRVWCNARADAVTLYERAGLRVASERFELPRIGPHYVMELVPPSVAA